MGDANLVSIHTNNTEYLYPLYKCVNPKGDANLVSIYTNNTEYLYLLNKCETLRVTPT